MGWPRIGMAPWGMLGALVAIGLIEVIIAHHDLDLTTADNMDWRTIRRAAVKKAPGCEILCLGTSMVQEGVLPRVIEQRAGKKTYNLAVCGGRVQLYYYYLKRALAAGARPSTVLVDFHPFFIATDYSDGQSWPDALGFWDCLDMSWNVRDPNFFASTVLARSVPSIYHRHQLRAATLAALRGESWTNRHRCLTYTRNINQNQGSLIGHRNPDYRGEISETYQGMFLPKEWRCHPLAELYIHKFLDLAASHGIRVQWLVMPLTPGLQAGREAKGLDESYIRAARAFQNAHPNLFVIDARHSGYDNSVFLDACHIDFQGAFALTKGIIDVLDRHEARPADTPRWVALPQYEESPIESSLIEDISQSYQVIATFGLREAGVVRR